MATRISKRRDLILIDDILFGTKIYYMLPCFHLFFCELGFNFKLISCVIELGIERLWCPNQFVYAISDVCYLLLFGFGFMK